MKRTAAILSLFLAALIAAPAFGACPVGAGVYSTYSGDCLSGRASEAWCGLDGTPGPGETGNVDNAMSWDGATLGTEWKAWGMTIDAAGPSVVENTVDADGNGYIVYSTDYDGGQFWMSKDGAWGDGVNDLTGTIAGYNIQARITYVAGIPVAATANVYFTGTFDDCPTCYVEYTIANAMLVWRSDWDAPMPDGYPPYLCDTVLGELYTVCCVQISIDCVSSTEGASWGGLKSLFR